MVFDHFPSTPYTFLELASGAGGQRVVTESEATGIFKYREGLMQTGTSETYGNEDKTNSPTLHMRPDEPFITAVGGHQKLVGHGIRVDGVNYRIMGAAAGRDFETGSTEFYRVVLRQVAL